MNQTCVSLGILKLCNIFTIFFIWFNLLGTLSRPELDSNIMRIWKHNKIHVKKTIIEKKITPDPHACLSFKKNKPSKRAADYIFLKKIKAQIEQNNKKEKHNNPTPSLSTNRSYQSSIASSRPYPNRLQ